VCQSIDLFYNLAVGITRYIIKTTLLIYMYEFGSTFDFLWLARALIKTKGEQNHLSGSFKNLFEMQQNHV
jgi:hypothetical protein